jgi:hypothetical protein
LEQLSAMKGIQGQIFGQTGQFDGFGGKFQQLIPLLKNVSANDLIVISDSRDVLINNPKHTTVYHESSVQEFRMNFEKLTINYPGSIVISAEAQCCVAALTHIEPGQYFHADGSRNVRACSSGEPGCLWQGDDQAKVWENVMKEIAMSHTDGEAVDDMYLNAGLITGRAGDVLRILSALQINVEEDDQAVLTDYMYYHKGEIILDYGQTLFGNNRGGLGGIEDGSCVFVHPKLTKGDMSRLVHIHTFTTPLFVHSPGGFYECYETLASELGYEVTTRPSDTQRRTSDTACQYATGCAKNSDAFFARLRQRRLELKEARGRLQAKLFGGRRR